MKRYFLKYSEFLNESLKTARIMYLDNNQIEKEVFDKLVSIDPTSTKKYLEQLCLWYMGGTPIEELEYYIKKFHRLLPSLENRDRNIDNPKYLHFEDFKKFLDKTESKTAIKKEITKDVEVVYEDDNVQITKPKTYEESCILGAGTKWCTASRDTKQHWYSYTGKLLTFYYIWFKKLNSNNPNYKIAVGVSPNGNLIEIFDAKDKRMDTDVLRKRLNKYKVPEGIFVSNVDLLKVLDTPSKMMSSKSIRDIIISTSKYHTQEIFDKFISCFPQTSDNIDILIARVPNFQTMYYFDKYISLEPSVGDFFRLVGTVTNFQTQEYLDKIISLNLSASIFGDLIIEAKGFQTQENFDRFISMNPEPFSIRHIIQNVDSFQTQENFDVLMSKNPYIVQVSGVIQTCKNFQTKYYFDRFMELNPDSNQVASMIREVNDFQSEYYYEIYMSMNPDKDYRDLDYTIRLVWGFEEWYKKKYKQQ